MNTAAFRQPWPLWRLLKKEDKQPKQYRRYLLDYQEYQPLFAKMSPRSSTRTQGEDLREPDPSERQKSSLLKQSGVTRGGGIHSLIVT